MKHERRRYDTIIFMILNSFQNSSRDQRRFQMIGINGSYGGIVFIVPTILVLFYKNNLKAKLTFSISLDLSLGETLLPTVIY